MSVIFTLKKIQKISLLFFLLICCSSVNATTYYLRNNLTGAGQTGNWNDPTTWSTSSGGTTATNTGPSPKYPVAGDTVIYSGSSTNSITLNITSNAACASFTNQCTGAGSVVTFNFSSGVTLAISGAFSITTVATADKTVTLTGTGTMTVGGDIGVGTTITPTQSATKTVRLNFQGPDITLAGNLNIINNVASTKYLAAYVYHNTGKLSLTGTGLSGYINTYMNGTGLSSNNRYTTGVGTASVEFYHTGDVPIYAQYAACTPNFNASGTTVTYRGSGSQSYVYGTTYYNLYLNNSAGYTTTAPISIQNQFDMVAGNLSIPYNFAMDQNNTLGYGTMNISSGSGIQSTGGTFSLNSSTIVNYSGSVTAAGVEFISGTNDVNTKLKSLSINCSSFDLGADVAVFVKDAIAINVPNFTCNESSLNCKSITLSGNNSTYNSVLNTVYTSGLNTLFGNLIVNGTSIINGNVSAETTLNAASTVNGTINSNTINVNAVSTINGDITTGILNVNAATTLNNVQEIIETLNLAANLTNDSNVFVPNVNVSNNSTLTPSGEGTINISNVLSVDSGKVLNANDDITLVSDGNGTARVNQVSSGAIIGNVNVQRYLKNNKRCWRLLTAPVTGSSNNSIYVNWQNNGAQINNGEPANGTGADLWGPSDTYDPASNGLYYLNPSTHNFRKYNNGWTSVTNSMTEALFTASKNNAFLAFITHPAGLSVGVGLGDNGGNIATSDQASTNLLAKGQLLTGTQTYTINSNTYSLIGNPYASTIDFTSLVSSAGVNGGTVSPKLWVIDPAVSTFGNYVTWDPVNHWNDPNAQNSINQTTTIQSGQAFFVKGKTSASSSTFTIQESNKVSSTSFNVFGKTQNIDYDRLRMTVSKIENGSETHKDACVVAFYEGASNQVDDNDVQKFTNPAETLSFLNGTTTLSSEHRAPIVDGDVIFIKLSQAVESAYKLKIYTENFTFTGTAYLYDLFLGTNVALPIDGSVYEYTFNVTSDAASQGGRFKIVFSTVLSTVKNDNPYSIVAYPNPTTKSNGVNLNLGSLEYGSYNYKIVNVLGQEIQNGTIDKKQLNQEVAINFNNSIIEGWYAIQILEKNTILFTLPILIK